MQSQTQYISSGSVIFENRIIDRRTLRTGAKRTNPRFLRGITDLQKIHPLALEKFLLDFLTIVWYNKSVFAYERQIFLRFCAYDRSDSGS